MCLQGAVFFRKFDRKRGFDREAARKTFVFRQPQTTRTGGFHCGLKFRDRSLKLCISGIACVAVAVGLVHGDQIAVIIKDTGIG